MTPTNVTAGDFTAERIWVPNQNSTGLTGLINGYTDSASVPFVARQDTNSTVAGLRVQGAAVRPMIEGIRSGGSITSPSAVQAAQNLLWLAGRGLYDTSNVSPVFGQAYVALVSAENWDATHMGANVYLGSTPAGSTSATGLSIATGLGFLSGGYLAAGLTTAPNDTTAGTISSTDRIYPGNTSNWHLAYASSKPTITVDNTDYYEYDRTNNRHSFFVASTEMYRIGATASEYKSYSARATNASGTQTIAAATIVAVTFATEDFDTGAIHDTGSNTSRMTAPVTGRYHVSGGIFWAAEALSTTTLLLVRLSLNGTPIPGARSYFPPISSILTNGQAQSIDCDVVLTAGQYVEMEAFFDAGASSRTLTLANCALSMHYIGGL